MDKAKILSRLWNQSSISDDDHWLWNGRKNPLGYGLLWVGTREDGNHYGVHRLSAFIHHELDLENTSLFALHKNSCKYKNCWKPECIYVGNQIDNGKDYRESRLFCKNGHPLSVHGYSARRHSADPSRRRKCRECARIARNKDYNKRKQQINQQRRQKTKERKK